VGGFDTFFLVQNPDPVNPAHLTVSFLGNDGEVDELYYTVAPSSRMTIWMDQEPGLDQGEFTAEMESDIPVVAERAVYFGYRDLGGGSVAEGAPDPDTRWYFAEGYTGGEFDSWILLANPNPEAVRANLTFMRVDGSRLERGVDLPPRSRRTVHVDEILGLEDAEFSIHVLADGAIAAERAMYFSYQGRDGGSCSQGAAAPALEWYFAEGYTGS
jgi:hypothetical protein